MSFKYGVFLMLLFKIQLGFSQTQELRKNNGQNTDKIIENLIETVAENQGEDFDYTEILERLNFYIKNKINLNKTTKTQLQELVFLNPLQINALLNHISINGKLINVLELQSVDGFDVETIKKLLLFVDINQPTGFENFSFKKMLLNGNSDILVRYQTIIEPQKGFTLTPESGKSRYLGTSDRILTRYRFNHSNNIQLSINLEKDAGEQYWATEGIKGPDFVSGSLTLSNIGAFKKIVIGDYALQFGQGLTMWSGLSFGKGADIFSVAKQDLGLRAYTSANEFSFLRGISTQIQVGKFTFTPFVSTQKIDASSTFNPISQSDEISTLQQSGLHRTPSELRNKARVHQLVYGGNIKYQNKKLDIGFTAYQTNYDQNFAPKTDLYNQFHFTGKQLTNLGIHYNYNFKNTYFYGEAAHSLGYGSAFINGLISSLSPSVSLLAFHRFYQKDYQSFFNQAISESTNAVNENGFYTGLQIKPNKKFELLSYFDMFRFPWLKYLIDAPSVGYEMLSQFSYLPNKVTRFTVRYRIEVKQQNSSSTSPIKYLENVKKQNLRTEVQYAINKSITLRNRIEMMIFKEESNPHRKGFMAYQDVNFNPMGSKLSGNLRLILFETEDYDTRIYAYESDVLYGFSIPAYQNQGVKFYLNGRYTLKRGIDFWLRYSITQYNNLNIIGSGLDEINGNKKSEVKLQARFQF